MQDEPRHFVATKNKVLKQQWGFPGGASGKKNPPGNAGDLRDVGSIPR